MCIGVCVCVRGSKFLVRVLCVEVQVCVCAYDCEQMNVCEFVCAYMQVSECVCVFVCMSRLLNIYIYVNISIYI